MDEYRDEQARELPELEAMKEYMEDMPIPSEIDAKIWSGIRAGRRRRRRKVFSRVAAYTACLLLLVSVVSVRFSPEVAAYVGEIPGLKPLVELIHYDKGLELAMDNDFMQPVGLSEERDGMKMTIDGIIADESRIIAFYSLENMNGQKSVVNLQGVKLTEHLEASISHGSSDFREDWDTKQGTIDFNFVEGVQIPDTLNVDLELKKTGEAATSGTAWHFAIPIDKAKFEGLKETYDINQTVLVEGQKIIFGKMTVYPTRIGIEVSYDPANTKKLFYFDDLRLEDEKGEEFGSITNGVSGSTLSENSQVLYLESNYFRKPKHLYLRASSIRALDKDKREVEVDLSHKKLLASPDDRLTLKDIGTSAEDGQSILIFEMKNEDTLDQNRMYSLFESTYKDASGKSFESHMTGSSGNGSDAEYEYYIPKENYQSPLTLFIQDYPTRIHGDIDIKIK
ncbi:DUF4179 domain-containing protein [Paenibacillus sp. JDR-2]|uniref:DUF4179 domain-containing protein n=1 Tax=Paenibacillus sp. (strain JDR-2) TaxID=324057 RepID=UPI000166B199|nr:DUF4179 domain-containing protein [Paenibacillus sp. JDR-2]ACS99050.1 hypothetical protein Pjdr2_0370 [Paenibacillus sp. JDR-2]